MVESNQYFTPGPPTEEVKNFDKETGSAQCHEAELWLAALVRRQANETKKALKHLLQYQLTFSMFYH
jgi:hypothetical protein